MKKGLFQLQYEVEDSRRYTEAGSDRGAKLRVDEGINPEVWQVLKDTEKMGYKGTIKYLMERQSEPGSTIMVVPITTRTPEALHYRLNGQTPKLIFLSRPLHTIERLDEQLYTVSQMVPNGTYLCCHAMTATLKRKLAMQQYPWGINYLVVGLGYLWHRVCPKLRLTEGLYFYLTGGKDRTMSRVEIIGRLYRAGFEVVDEQFREGEFFVTACKATEPVDDAAPNGSPIIHLRRIGKGGKTIVVHKFRTMYTYSEYVQPYIYHYQSLERGGKFKDDYRVNFWGRLLRRLWLDELPMIWNMLRGDLKLVGVRPLSRQYFSLYTPELQALRTKTKPGLLPPFYYEAKTPETLDEVQESEQRYLEAYLQAPLKTDWKYFWGIVGNILFNRKHSA
ncbi:MAG: sugar transferase [Bacteroidales bacterium]|nr:sugar transferase [Bacteroidales bacterium]